jgi:hypothetical protein
MKKASLILSLFFVLTGYAEDAPPSGKLKLAETSGEEIKAIIIPIKICL